MIEKLLVFFVPGLDYRRIDHHCTPFILDLINKFHNVRVTNVPTADNLPTILTGIYPPEHTWDVGLKQYIENKLFHKFLDKIPDIITTTFQCILHLKTGSYDLANVPPRRRRMFDIYRTRYIKKNAGSMLRFGKYDSILNIIGKENCIYITNSKMKKLPDITRDITSGDFRLKILETYSLDLIEHWNLDNDETIYNAYRNLDEIVKKLYYQCKDNGVAFMLFSDHGQDRVKSCINLHSELKKLKLSQNDYLYYIETFRARFWFYNDHARKKITNLLYSIDNTSVFTYEQMNQFDFNYVDNKYGEIFLIADPGYIFFPHDFYNPIINLYLGLKDNQQRTRIFNPVHRGNHHYLPSNDSEKGFLILADSQYIKACDQIKIGGFAPTILYLLNINTPSYMKGDIAFNC